MVFSGLFIYLFIFVSGVFSRPETLRLDSLSARRMATPVWGILISGYFHQPHSTLALKHIETWQFKNNHLDVTVSLPGLNVAKLTASLLMNLFKNEIIRLSVKLESSWTQQQTLIDSDMKCSQSN